MKIVLTTQNSFTSARLKDRILRSVNEGQVTTWSYAKAANNYDIIFHNLPQFTEHPEKNVVFRVELNGENIIFSTAYWTRNPQPIREMNCLHVGRLTEMILSYFQGEYTKFSILDR